MAKKYSVGDLVIFRQDLYPDEEGAIYKIIEINDDRCIIVLTNTNMRFPPQSVAILKELVVVAKGIKIRK